MLWVCLGKRGGGGGGNSTGIKFYENIKYLIDKKKNKVGADPAARRWNYSESDLVQLNLPKYREFNI